MTNNTKVILWIIVVISFLVSSLIVWINKIDVSSLLDLVAIIPQVVTIDVCIAFVFTQWLWKSPLFKGWLVTIPNLNGTWTGFIYTNWRDSDTGEGIPAIPVMLTVKQTLFGISCVMKTAEMRSDSHCCQFDVNPAAQIRTLSYVYSSEPRVAVRERSPAHNGAAVFEILEKPSRKLKGRYWTERETTGEIVLKYYSAGLLEELPEDFEEHPVTEEVNRR